jgi:aminopeptidase N
MILQDKLIHPALLDPRQWGTVDLYDATLNATREALPGDEHHTPDRTVALKYLKLDLHFDDEQESVSGSAALTFVPLNDGLMTVELDAAELDVRTVTLIRHERLDDGTVVEAAEIARRLPFETHREKLVLELPRSYSRYDQLTVEIVYSCHPRKGLFFIKPDDAYPDKPRQIWSQGQTEDAHWWFPCHDVTNQKMGTELRATVKANYFALSNGELIAVTENELARTKTYHWVQTEPHPAYLVTAVIGEYALIETRYKDLPLSYYVYHQRKDAGEQLFGKTPQMIELFEQKFGFAYPYAKYAQILVDDFLFGAMENTSAATFTDRCLLDECAGLDLNYEDIVAHELAHHWFGNLVTCKDWTQIWVNESFATYAEYLWREHAHGHDEARFVLFQDFLTYLREDLTSHRRSLLCKRYRYSEELMDRHAYEKGACILDMLRWVLGDEAFFRSLTLYLRNNLHNNGDDHALRAAIEEATGQNLHWFFANWVYGAGYPELEVSYDWQREIKLLKLSVKQVQELEEGVTVFKFPVEIEVVTETEKKTPQRTSYRVWLEQAEQDFYFPCLVKPSLVVFDKGHHLFKLMHFEKSAQELLFQLTHDEDLLGRMRAARELSEFKSAETVQALAAKLHSDDHYSVRMAAAISLGEIGTEAAQQALVTAYQAVESASVRRACLWALGNYQDEESAALLRHALANERSYFAAVSAARALAKLGGEQAYDVLVSALTRASWQEVVAASVFHGFAQAKEKRAVELALKHSRYGEPVPVRLAAIACLGALGKELQKENQAEKIVDALMELLKDKSLRARVATVRALGKVGNKRALGALREAQQRECLDQLKVVLLDAIEGLEKK